MSGPKYVKLAHMIDPRRQEVIDAQSAYLLSRGQFPDVRKIDQRDMYSDSAMGQFERNGDLGSRGRISLSWPESPSTYPHELQHAVEAQMSKQALTEDSSTQFKEAFHKLRSHDKLHKLAELIDPKFVAAGRDYRATATELPAFAVGNSVSPPKFRLVESPSHLDSTLATEAMILLELASRKKPPSKGGINLSSLLEKFK